MLPADEAGLAPFIFADGLRNTFDLAYTPSGDLLGCENSGERDDPDEINWIRKGLHYGFPWVMGGNYNPQQYPGYDPDADIMLNKNRFGYKNGFFYDDPTFPPMPPGLVIAPGISNYGPDADYFRDTTTGIVMQAGDLGIALNSITTHRSPNGIVFDYDRTLIPEFNNDAFMLGFQFQGDSAGNDAGGQTGTILDPSQDLVHLDLSKNISGDNYNMHATRIVSGFEKPVDACIFQNVIYVLEYANKNNKASLWKVTLPAAPAAIAASLDDENFCPGEPLEIAYNSKGIFNPGNIFTAQLSDENGNFSSPISIGNIAATASGNIPVIIPATVSAGDQYLIRIVSSDPPVTGSDNGEAFTIECPKPVSLSSENITATSAKVKWSEEGCAVNYQVKYRVAGGNWLKVNANANAKTLKELAPSTMYEWKVKTKCVKDPKVYGKFSPVKNFTTLPLKEMTGLTVKDADAHFGVFPNPFTSGASVKFFLKENEFAELSLFDAQGKKIRPVAAGIFSEGSHQVNLPEEGLPAGIYFLQMKTAGTTEVQKVVKE
ncbi:MAG TPA: T9SS type A sorting domain-containing protein [Chitinophagales bacterium]|nr:T9SS type A sorting domain-containing protein [Chitinophagales bacterium]